MHSCSSHAWGQANPFCRLSSRLDCTTPVIVAFLSIIRRPWMASTEIRLVVRSGVHLCLDHVCVSLFCWSSSPAKLIVRIRRRSCSMLILPSSLERTSFVYTLRLRSLFASWRSSGRSMPSRTFGCFAWEIKVYMKGHEGTLCIHQTANWALSQNKTTGKILILVFDSSISQWSTDGTWFCWDEPSQ